MTEKEILYENGAYWVRLTNRKDYEVYRVELTHSVRCAIIGYKGELGLSKAKAECDRRSNLDAKERA